MQLAAHMPTDDPSRHDLITAASRAAFQIEAAERRSDAREEAHQRVIYHTAQAELLARTTAFDAEAQARNEQTRDKHRRLAEEYRWELEKLTRNDPEAS